MSKPADVLSQLKTQLENSTDLSYVKNIFLGYREGITQFPVIILEPMRIVESDDVYGRQELRFSIAVIGFIAVKDKERQIVGDSNYKGILDFENDIKKAISADRTLNGLAIHTSFIETRYEFVEYPVRGFAIDIEVRLRQDTEDRT